MAFQVSWHQEPRIAHTVISGDFPIEELQSFGETMASDYLDQGQTPVHLVVDLRQIGKIPMRIDLIKDATRPFFAHPAMGWLIIVGRGNPMVGFLASTTTRFFGVQFRMVDTPDEALRILRNVDKTLAH